MDFSITRKILVNLHMDSSEAIMFTKNGRHSIKIDASNLNSLCEDVQREYLNDDGESIGIQTELYITIQLKDQSRFSFITSEAEKHKERIKNEGKHT